VKKEKNQYKAIAIGTSAGGLFALSTLLQELPADFPVPVLVVQHRAKDQKSLLEEVLQSKTRIRIKQADEKETIKKGIVYIAPPDYHLLVEEDDTFSLSSDEFVRYSRPSIDVLFESSAVVFREKLVGIILTGASNDGAAGIKAIARNGGLTIAQNPAEAEYPYMPQASIDTKKIKHVWTLQEIKKFLLEQWETKNE
jgi:two-component system, chemotaxis family, protein-glutamate methylesterase/glutaminase